MSLARAERGDTGGRAAERTSAVGESGVWFPSFASSSECATRRTAPPTLWLLLGRECLLKLDMTELINPAQLTENATFVGFMQEGADSPWHSKREG